MKENKQFLIAFIGPVGSGKTHVARILAKKLRAVHVRTDDIRVSLGRRGKSFSSAPRRAHVLLEKGLRAGRSVIADFDAVKPERRETLKKLAQRFGAQFVLIKIITPEKLLLLRLKKKRYTKNELFRGARHATRVYFARKKFHERMRRRNKNLRPDFVISNAKPLAPQIRKIIKKLKGP